MGFVDKFKEMMGLEENFYDDEEYTEDYEYNDGHETYVDHEEYVSETPSSNRTYESSKNNSYERATRRGDSIIEMNDSLKKDAIKIVIHEPVNYEDSPKIIEDILAGQVVVMNLEMLDKDIKSKIFEFVTGGMYAIDGNMQKVTGNIIVLSPKGLDIDNTKVQTQIENNGLFQI